MKKILLGLFSLGVMGCSMLQNPFTGGSTNYAFIQAVCTAPMIATNPQFALACSMLGLLQPSIPPMPTPGK